MSKLKVLSLFSGIGAFEKSLTNIGVNYELVGFSEIDKYAIESYCAIHDVDQSLNLGDVSKVDIEDIPCSDLITYGFPCQDISIAGSQKGIVKGETRSGLLYEALRVIEGKKPKYAIAENVKNLVGKKFKKDFESMLIELDEMGYNSYWEILNAKHFGVAQNRERVFVISIRKDIDDGKFEFPKPFDSGLRLKDFLLDKVEEKYYINNERVEELLSKLKNGQKGHYPNVKDEPLSSSALSSREHRGTGWSEDIGTLCARDYKDPKVIAEPTVCEQRTDEGLRFFKDDVCGTIRTIDAGGDKRVIEKTSNEPLLVGGIGEKNFGKQYRQGNRVYDSNAVAMCLLSQPVGNTGGNSYLYIVEDKQTSNDLKLFTNLSGGKWDKIHESARRVYDESGISPTIPTCGGGNIEPKVQTQYRIRKLIPLECWRLMGFTDEDYWKARKALEDKFYKGKDRSNSQMYKQAGNSIVVNVLEEIFKNLFQKYNY